MWQNLPSAAVVIPRASFQFPEGGEQKQERGVGSQTEAKIGEIFSFRM